MKTLEKNIINSQGARGTEWIHSLPHIIEELAQHWALTNIQPVKKMSWNYVAFALQNKRPVVLKIGFDKQLIQDEYRALKHFNGQGAITALDIAEKYHAILIEQAIPGHTLKENYDITETIKIYSQVVKKIAAHPLENKNYLHANKWCESIDEIRDVRVAKHLIEQAKSLKSFLLSSMEHEYLCHGDLHLENIIQQENQWLAIDPKGIIGEIAFEAAAFDLFSKDETQDTIKITERVVQLSTALNIPFDRLLFWIFVRAMLSAQWFIEDGGDPSQMLKLAKQIYPLIKK